MPPTSNKRKQKNNALHAQKRKKKQCPPLKTNKNAVYPFRRAEKSPAKHTHTHTQATTKTDPKINAETITKHAKTKGAAKKTHTQSNNKNHPIGEHLVYTRYITCVRRYNMCGAYNVSPDRAKNGVRNICYITCVYMLFKRVHTRYATCTHMLDTTCTYMLHANICDICYLNV